MQGTSSNHKKMNQWAAAVAVIALLWAASVFCGCDPVLFWQRKGHLTDILSQMIPPDMAYVREVLGPLAATIRMSVTGTVLGAFLGLLAAPVCAACTGMPAPARHLLRLLIQVLRAFPALILALLATFFFGLGTFAGTAAITVYTFAIIARLTYEDMERAPISAFRALTAMGVSPGKASYRALLPEVLSSYLTNTLYLLETNVRHSAILGYVGAGGLGLLLNEKISWREYDKVGTILLLLLIAVLIIERIGAWLTEIACGRKKLSRAGLRSLGIVCSLIFLICLIGVGLPDFEHTSLSLIRSMLTGLVHIDWSFFCSLTSEGLPYLLLETIGIALLGTVSGMLAALPVSFLASRRLMGETLPGRLISGLFTFLIALIRSVPFLIYGLIFIRVCGPGAFTGILTMGFCSIGLLSKRITQAIDALDLGPYRALQAMGIPWLIRIRYAILPQLMPAFISAVLYRFDVNTREAAILGIVGAGGIGGD